MPMTLQHGRIFSRALALPIGLLAASLAVSGCGQSSTRSTASFSSSQSPSATSDATTTSGTGSPSSSGGGYTPLTKRQLAALLPTAALLPGWKVSPSSDTPDDPATLKQDAELAACAGAPNSDPLQVAQASSPDLSLASADGSQAIAAHVSSFKTTAAVAADVAALRDPRYPACFEKQLAAHGAELFGSGFTYVSSNVAVTPGTTATVAGSIDAVLNLKTATGRPAVFAITEVALVGPGVEESVMFIAAGKPVSAAVGGAVIA